MNKRLRLAVRNAACTNCRLHADTDAEDVCTTGNGPNGARVVVVTRAPLGEDSKLRRELEDYFDEVGLDSSGFMWTSAIKCHSWSSVTASKGDQKACAPYLRAEFAHINPDWVITFGAEAWFAASGHANITANRGKLFDVVEGDGQVFPTISPAAVMRSPGMRAGFMADLRYFARLVRGEGDGGIAHHNNDGHRTVVADKDTLRAALKAIQGAWAVSYDIETNSGSEWLSGAVIASIAVTVVDGPSMDGAHTWEIPLGHPESWLVRSWRQVVAYIVKALKLCPRRIAHNAKFDTKWLRQFAGDIELVPTFDTIIASALMDENSPHGLKPLAATILGAEPWGINTRDIMTTPLGEVLEYNGLDTWHTLRLYFYYRAKLEGEPRTRALFQHLMMPLVQELIPVEMRGVYVDQPVLATNWNTVRAKLADIDAQLMEWVPETNPFIKIRKRDGVVTSDGINFGPSNFLRWWLYESLNLPTIRMGKTGPSVAEDVMMELAEHHPAGQLLVDRVKWNKFDTSFFRPWTEQLDDTNRLHSTFKPWGTVTGRLSSGKEDAEKVTASKQIMGVNMQQVPRDPLARGVFGAPPGYVFVEFDYSQVELRVAAMLAQESTMLHLYNTGQDIHMAMAMTMTGKPASAVTYEERKAAKAVNFGFLYGMGWRKFIATAWSNYGLRVTEEEAQAFRKAFFAQFPKLIPWHARQRRLAHQYGRVMTPMGRVRHLPDINSPDEGKQAEAERQAINSPVQGFASDMAAWSLVRTARTFRKHDIRAYPICAVHDAVNFEIHADDVAIAAPIIKRTMENLPLERVFGVHMSVPIVADMKAGRHWGGSKEVPADIVMDDGRLTEWLTDNGLVGVA